MAFIRSAHKLKTAVDYHTLLLLSSSDCNDDSEVGELLLVPVDDVGRQLRCGLRLVGRGQRST